MTTLALGSTVHRSQILKHVHSRTRAVNASKKIYKSHLEAALISPITRHSPLTPPHTMRFTLFAVIFGPFVASLFALASASPAPAAASAPKKVKIPIDDFLGPNAVLMRTTTEGPTVGTRLTEVPVALAPDGLFDKIDCKFRQNKCDRQ